jgi:hypothetical protein
VCALGCGFKGFSFFPAVHLDNFQRACSEERTARFREKKNEKRERTMTVGVELKYLPAYGLDSLGSHFCSGKIAFRSMEIPAE